jgi:hypothetical protein
MVWLITLLPTPSTFQAANQPAITADQAIDAGTHILTAFGVDGPFTTTFVRPISENGQTNYFAVVCEGSGAKFQFSVDGRTGRCWHLRRGEYVGGMLPPRPTDAIDVHKQIATAETGMRQLFGKAAVLSGKMRPQGNDDWISVPIAVRGYPFIGRYPGTSTDEGCASVRLDARTGVLQEYSDWTLQAAIDLEKPKIDEKEAVAIVERMIKVKIPKRRTEWYLGKTAHFDPSALRKGNDAHDYERQLGWFLPKDAKIARLAWRIPYEWRWRTAETTGTQYYGDIGEIWIDAATGKPLGQYSEKVTGTL